MNKIFLIGNLTHDPDSNTTQSGVEYCKFSIAVARRFKRDETDFINCVAFKKTAELAGKYLSKGSKVAIAGSIQTGSYEKDGQKRYTTDVIAEEVQFLPKGEQKQENKGEQQEPEQVKVTMVDDNSDLPF